MRIRLDNAGPGPKPKPFVFARFKDMAAKLQAEREFADLALASFRTYSPQA